MNWLIALLILVLASACSVKHTPPTQAEVNLQTQSEMTRTECYRMRATVDSGVYTAIASLPKEDRLVALLLLKDADSDAQVIAAATGHSLDPCDPGTTLNDVAIAEMREGTKRTGQLVETGKWVIGTVGAVVVTDNIVSSLADAGSTYYAASENSKLNVNSQNSNSQNQVAHDYQSNGDNKLANQDENCIDCDGNEGDFNDGSPEGSDNPDEVLPEEPVDPEHPIEPNPDFDVDSCNLNPPGGVNSVGTPLWGPNCSCNSKYEGKC